MNCILCNLQCVLSEKTSFFSGQDRQRWLKSSPFAGQGVLSNAINWDLLERQYVSDTVYRNELMKMIQEIGCVSVHWLVKQLPEALS